tara:strand:- start:151 stop:255 length:105 start_codon:yes stop_codon:yes gene_type:complete
MWPAIDNNPYQAEPYRNSNTYTNPKADGNIWTHA